MIIGHFSQHIGTAVRVNARTIGALNIHVGGLTEMDQGPKDFVDEFQDAIGTGYFVYSMDKGQHSSENAGIIRKSPKWKTTAIQAIKLSDDIPGGGTGNDRWVTIVKRARVNGKKKRCHMFTHLNAGIQNMTSGAVHITNKRTQANAQSMIILKKLVLEAIAEGFEVTLQGDFNYKRMPKSKDWDDWKYAPDNFFKDILTFYDHKLDWIGWSKEFKRGGEVKVIPRNDNHDHDWFYFPLVYK